MPQQSHPESSDQDDWRADAEAAGTNLPPAQARTPPSSGTVASQVARNAAQAEDDSLADPSPGAAADATAAAKRSNQG